VVGRQLAQLNRPRGIRARQNALGGVARKLLEPFALEALYPLTWPALTLEQGLAFAHASCEILKALDPIAHPVILRRLRE
jgi:hypothetical protein